MQLVTYNIQYGVGKDWKTDLDRIVTAVDGADVIALQEVVRHMPMTGAGDQPAELAARLPGYYWVYGAGVDLDRSERSADGTVVNRRMQFGNMLLARRPILSSRAFLLPKLAAVDHQTSQRVALEGIVEAESGPLRFFSIHLSAFSSRERKLQVAELLRLFREGPLSGGVCDGANNWAERNGLSCPAVPEATVMMGDFNFEPGPGEYAMMTGEPDPVYGRVATRDVLVDAWVRAGHGEEEGVTCPFCPENDTIHDMRIDYIYVSAGLAGQIRGARIDNDAQGSDHQPVWAELEV
ncbi:MAG: endonuclease/exonuclease/phosphatase family protein [Kiloniellales bacterium]|nr:endonuclease/exonuclease/phosphatase family protein [Kiloniellales bacterium]